MPKIPKPRSTLNALGACVLLLSISTGLAQNLDSSVQAEKQINDKSALSQTRVSGLARQTQDLLTEYRSIVRETESLTIYNDNLKQVVDDQRSEVQSINRQLAGLEDTNRGVVPLMLEMIEALGPIVGKTPRAVKRFVNLYRFIRGMRRGPDLDAFLDRMDEARRDDAEWRDWIPTGLRPSRP